MVFLEKVYERALEIELRKQGLACYRQQQIKVYYATELVGDYIADIIVNDLVIVELKAQEHLTPDNEAQLLNYLKATRYEIGLLLNFGPQPQIKRKIFDNEQK